MSDLLAERTVLCPTCWESSVVVIDLSEGDKTVIEDCQVCCNPMQLTLTIDDGELVNVEVEPAQ